MTNDEEMLLAGLLLEHGYVLKSGSPGYWVDGSCGYSVSSYHDSPGEAISHAIKVVLVEERKKKWNGRPSWYAAQAYGKLSEAMP